MTEIIGVKFKSGGKQYYFDPNGLTVKTGQGVIVETGKGMEYGVCSRPNGFVEDTAVVQPLRPVIRIATESDERTVADNVIKERQAMRICQEKIEKHELDMKLVRVEYAFDGSKVLFFFTSEGRVDFRALVKDLAAALHARIELRQIGVRDEARMLGGLGICGKPFCCAQFLNEFQPVSIKMAKTQSLSLNPTKISGTCGRLMCCLNYEQAAYEDLLRTAPKAESFVDTPEGRGTVVEVDLLRQRVKVKMELHPETISVFPNSEIAVLRSGKAKKNDPPIPEDLAPISGAGRRARKEEPAEEKPLFLDSIKFRYSTETIADQTSPEDLQPEETDEHKEQPSRNRRRRRSRGGQSKKPAEGAPQQKPQQKQEQKPQQKQADKPADPDAAPKSKQPGRRPYHRRRKPNKPAGGNTAE